LRSIKTVASTFSVVLGDVSILVAEEQSDAPSQMLSLLKEDPLKKVIVINLDRYLTREMDKNYPSILKYPNVRSISSVREILEDLFRYAEELKNVNSEIKAGDFKIDQSQRKYSSQIM
jgi:hypothetical protein